MKISKRSCIGESITGQTPTHLRTKRKTIKMLICVVATFAICWLPYNLLFIVEDFFHINFSLTIHYLTHWLAMSSICYNPFIYFWLNRGYRQGIMNVLTCCRCCCCCRHQLSDLVANNDNNNNDIDIDYMNDAMSEMDTINIHVTQNANNKLIYHRSSIQRTPTEKRKTMKTMNENQLKECENKLHSNGYNQHENNKFEQPSANHLSSTTTTITKLTRKPSTIMKTIIKIVPHNLNHHMNSNSTITMT